MIRHIELTINFDLTCWGQDEADFETDTDESIREEVEDFIDHNVTEIIDHIKINKVWYEKG